jgi:hypothetical protein
MRTLSKGWPASWALLFAGIGAASGLGCSIEPSSSSAGKAAASGEVSSGTGVESTSGTAGAGSGGGSTSDSSGASAGASAGASSGGAVSSSRSPGGVDAGTQDATVVAASGGGNGDGGPGGDASTALPLATQSEYLTSLYALCDTLLGTQITQAGAANYGALVSPSTNPTANPVHSRAAEAVYPLAVAYKHSQQAKYANAAAILGDWLVSIQDPAGFWIEEWPAASGWEGTSADQVISLAGAYSILKSMLSSAQATNWETAITKCANWMLQSFPSGNINYTPTEANALVLASRAVANPNPDWLTTASTLMNATLMTVNSDNFIVGEGTGGVDLGYNIAQSIGEIALYGRLTSSQTYLAKAADLLKTHDYFMYPNGSIDNSWGTRSFKWILESGTKTAPGVHLALALVADQDPSIERGAQLALAFLRSSLDANGWLVYGPQAFEHPDSNPPDNYPTFARAQSLATAVEFGPAVTATAPIPADATGWFKYFPTVKTGVLRTSDIMATVTAYGSIATYPRESVVRGGSVSALWFAGYGSTGFLQVSSQTNYTRIEVLHMPIEGALLPLTPRVETSGGTYFTNVYDDTATLAMSQTSGAVQAVASGALRDMNGVTSGITFSWSYEFDANSYSKELQISSSNGVRIVEPFVDNPGNTYAVQGNDTFQISTQTGGIWQVKVVSSTGPYQLVAGQDQAKYWSPFPGVQCYPLIIAPTGNQAGSYTIKYTVTRTN